MSTISTLAVRLDDLLVGYLTHYPDEKTIFVVDERSVIRRMSGPHTADNAALIRPTVGVVLGGNPISTH